MIYRAMIGLEWPLTQFCHELAREKMKAGDTVWFTKLVKISPVGHHV